MIGGEAKFKHGIGVKIALTVVIKGIGHLGSRHCCYACFGQKLDGHIIDRGHIGRSKADLAYVQRFQSMRKRACCGDGCSAAFAADAIGQIAVETGAVGQCGGRAALKDHIRTHALQKAQRFVQVSRAQAVHLIGVRDLILIIPPELRKMEGSAIRP